MRKEHIKLMKTLRILQRNIRDSFKSVIRNFSLSVASITCIAITMVLLSIAIIVSYNVNSFTKDLAKDLTIVVFMKRDALPEDVNVLKEQILDVDNVITKETIYLSKEEIKKSMQQESDVFNSIMSTWTDENNPLQNQFEVKVKNVLKIGNTANIIKTFPLVDSVKYGEQMVDRVLVVFDAIEKVTVGIVISLIVVTAFLISNTIKLTIFSRRNEIEIMRLVGTSNIVIRLPFLFEGLILGVLGSILPIIFTIYGYIIAYEKTGGFLFTNLISLVKPFPFVLYVSLLIVIVGAIVGMLGSYRAVRKYLKI